MCVLGVYLHFPGQLALLTQSQLPAFASTTRQLVPYRRQQSAAPAAVAPQRSRLDNTAEFVVTTLDDLINWARKAREMVEVV